MLQAYSRLRQVLDDQHLSVSELHRRIRQGGLHVNLKSLYRLRNEEAPLERLDLRVAGAICDVCQVPLSAWITFQPQRATLRRLPAAQQRRLDVLMAKNNEGKLSRREQSELQTLVRQAEAITLENARLLAQQRQPRTKD
jgi:hypothetical protein